MSDRVLIFANPIAGRGRGQKIAERLAAQLTRSRLKADLIFERPDGLPDTKLPDGIRAAISIGGDGTVSAAVRRLFRRFGADVPPMLVVPMGTANLLGRHLGTLWPDDQVVANATQAIRSMQTRQLDVGRANGELFLLMAGIGLDGKIIHELDRIRSGPIHLASYTLPAALAFGSYAYPPLTVSVDEKPIVRDLPGFAFVGNIKEYGAGLSVLPHARPDDGLLDVCVLPCSNRMEAIRQFLLAAAGDHVSAEGAIYTRGKVVRIEAHEPVPVQIDGEAAGHTPLRCDLLAARLPFIVG